MFLVCANSTTVELDEMEKVLRCSVSKSHLPQDLSLKNGNTNKKLKLFWTHKTFKGKTVKNSTFKCPNGLGDQPNITDPPNRIETLRDESTFRSDACTENWRLDENNIVVIKASPSTMLVDNNGFERGDQPEVLKESEENGEPAVYFSQADHLLFFDEETGVLDNDLDLSVADESTSAYNDDNESGSDNDQQEQSMKKNVSLVTVDLECRNTPCDPINDRLQSNLQGLPTYQSPILPLVLNNFRLSSSAVTSPSSSEPSSPYPGSSQPLGSSLEQYSKPLISTSIPIYSFSLNKKASYAEADVSDSFRKGFSNFSHLTEAKRSSPTCSAFLPPISDFQTHKVSTFLDEERETTSSLIFPKENDMLVDPILVEPTNYLAELDHGLSFPIGYESLFNLSVSAADYAEMPLSASKTFATDLSMASQHLTSSNFSPSASFPHNFHATSSVGITTPVQPLCTSGLNIQNSIQQALPAWFQGILQYQSDPNLQNSSLSKDEDRLANHTDLMADSTTWNQFGTILDNVQTLTNEDNGWWTSSGITLENETDHKKDTDGDMRFERTEDLNDWFNAYPYSPNLHKFEKDSEDSSQPELAMQSNESVNQTFRRTSGGYLTLCGNSSVESSQALPFQEKSQRHQVNGRSQAHGAHSRFQTHHNNNRLKQEHSSQSYNSSTSSRKTKRSICLWQFLKELLLYPETYQSWIRWVDRNKGVFKIEDSMNVARLWGERKNRPAMNYDKLSRSIRQYYKKGIIRKTTSSKRLVYQFCPQYL